MKDREKKAIPQTQSSQPGKESEMTPTPESRGRKYLASGKLKDKVAIIDDCIKVPRHKSS